MARRSHGLAARVLAVGLRRFWAIADGRRAAREARAAATIQRSWMVLLARRELLINVAAICRLQAMVCEGYGRPGICIMGNGLGYLTLSYLA